MSKTWNIIILGIAIEIMIAVTAIIVKMAGTCGNCGDSIGSIAIGIAGAILYSVLLATALWWGPCTFLFAGIFGGFVVHAGLVIMMISSGPLCPLCLAAAGISAALFIASLVHDRANLRLAALVIPATAILFQVGHLVHGTTKASALERVRAEAVPEGRVRLVIFGDRNCPYCQILEREILPGIELEFGPRLELIRRAGSEIPGIALPTVIVLGATEEVFEGLPSLENLRAAIGRALEKRHVSTPVPSNP